MKRALRVVVPLYEDRKFTENYNFRNVQGSGRRSIFLLAICYYGRYRSPVEPLLVVLAVFAVWRVHELILRAAAAQ
jgi:hypothetical protein